jgi:hypothetical protein
MHHAWQMLHIHTQVLRVYLKGRDCLEDLDIDTGWRGNGNTSCDNVDWVELTHSGNLVKRLINFEAIYPRTGISWLMLPTASSLVCTYNE